MQSTLKETLPVYVMFTKIDLVAGFAEFFGDLKKSERSQAWGSTILLSADKREPGKLFDAEFETLVEHLHTRGLKRMALERNREAKEKVYQFPLEFAAIKRNLSDFLAAAFAGGGTGPQPILRGFYFTSGLQEGRPLDRVVGAMGRAFGLRGGPAEDAPAEKVESKSFFLKDVFENVVFPDQDLAARSEAEIRRLRLRRLGVAAVAAFFALAFLIPSIISFYNNEGLVSRTEKITKAASGVDWNNPTVPALDKVKKLDDLRAHVSYLYAGKENGPEVGYGVPMYQGNTLYEPTKDEYIESLHRGFVEPTKVMLEEKLERATGADYAEDYNNLKTYLLLDDKIHLQDNAEWETGRLTLLWASYLKRTSSDVSDQDLRAKLLEHVAFYVQLLKEDQAKGEKLNLQLIGNVRDRLSRVGEAKALYAKFVTALSVQKYDESGPDTPDNLKFPPVTLESVFPDRQEVLAKMRSSSKDRGGGWAKVEGPYTYRGHEQVLASLENGVKELEREKWVVPLTSEEQQQGERMQRELDRVRQDYDTEYINQWIAFFRDIQVEIPANNKEAINEFKVLSTPDWPYQRLLRALADNTQFDEVAEKNQAESTLLSDGGVLDQLRVKAQQRIDQKIHMQSGAILNGFGGGAGERADPVPEKFRSMVRFAVPPPPPKNAKDGATPPPSVELNTYVGKLQDLAGEMGNIEDGPPSADTQKATEKFEDAVKATQAQLLHMDETGQELMAPLLMNPLKQAYKAVIKHAGGAASGLWEVAVWPSYRDKIKDRYPFNLSSTRDASLEDAVAFFKPKSGILWGFYEQYLKPFHNKVGHDFIPEAHLEARPRPAKPFTPFRGLLYPCLKRADEITDALFPPARARATRAATAPSRGSSSRSTSRP